MLADVGWFRSQFRALYGFDVPGVDYDRPVDPDLRLAGLGLTGLGPP